MRNIENGDIVKAKLMLIFFLIPIIIFSESLDSYSYEFPVKNNIIKSFLCSPIGQNVLTNKYFSRLILSSQESVYPILSGKVISIEEDVYKNNIYKLGIEHSQNMKSYYILSNPKFDIGADVEINSPLGISINVPRSNLYYMDFAIKLNEKYVYPELVNLMSNFDLSLLFTVQSKIGERKIQYLNNFSFSNNNINYGMFTLKEELTNDFIISYDNWKNQFHSYNYEIYQKEGIKIVYLENFTLPVEIHITDNFFRIDNIIHVDSTYHEVVEAFGLPSRYSLEGSLSQEIQDSADILLEHNVINLDQIKSIDYYILENGANYSNIRLRLYLSNGIITQINLMRNLP